MQNKPPNHQQLKRARKLLQLGQSATLAEIKQAYRRLAKLHHPDTGSRPGSEAPGPTMPQLNEAYRFLLDYCSNFRFPLEPGPHSPKSDEDWWMDRFGNDPIWGKD